MFISYSGFDTECFSLFTTSCDNNDEPNVSKPVATLAEVGEENSKTATAGKDMHLEGNIEAEGLIARIDVAVTSADGLTTVVAKSWTDGKYIGVRNTTFHEHIDISSETAAGEYVLTFTVTDKAGQSSVFKSSLKITTPVEGSPEITNRSGTAQYRRRLREGIQIHRQISRRDICPFP